MKNALSILNLEIVEVSKHPKACLNIFDNWKFQFCESMYGDRNSLVVSTDALEQYTDCYRRGLVELTPKLIEIVSDAIYMSNWFEHTIYFEGNRIFLSIGGEKIDEIFNIERKEKLRNAKTEITHTLQESIDEEETQIFWIE